MKKTLSFLMILAFLLSSAYCTSYATSVNRTKDFNETKSTEGSKSENKENKSNSVEEKTQTPSDSSTHIPEIIGEAAFLFNPETETVMYEKNADQKMFPASTTKILTAYLAILNLNLDSQLTASETAVNIDKDGSNMGLTAGEILTARQLIEAMLIQSANDAANVLAEAVSGSVEEFVNLMNETVSAFGLKNTHFENPHGYHHDNHYTTARDMSVIASKAMENETFSSIISNRKLVIEPSNKFNEQRIYTTRNAMINPYSDPKIRYKYATGIKTGHTSNAGYCFVGSATRSNMDLISIVFKSSSYERAFLDTKNLFEYAHSKYRIQTVNKADEIASTCKVRWAWGKDHLVLKTNKDVKTILPKEGFSENLLKSEIVLKDKITAPIQEGEKLGSIRYYYDEKLVAESGLYACRSVSKNIFKQVFSYLLNGWFLSILGVIVVIIIFAKIKDSKKHSEANRY